MRTPLSMNEETMWTTIDEWFKDNIAENEAVTTVAEGGASVGIRYWRITKGKLIQRELDINKQLLQKLNENTIKTIMADIIEIFRMADE